MSLANRNLVTIEDFSNQEIEAVFSLADEMADSAGEQSNVCRGKIMASLFFEPSTRTRLSFEAAMLRLGGGVISVAEIGNTSLSKGESIADMARVVGSYADIVVIRHPWEGAARVVADYAGVPVINAGDGGHEHPTQTLCDLYTIKKERKTLEGLKIALWGDLKYGRTVHSLTYALARFGATIHFRSRPGFEIPEHVIKKLTTEYGFEVKRYEDLKRVADGKGSFPLDAIYITPTKPHQLAMVMPEIDIQIEAKRGLDTLYVSSIREERGKEEEEELRKQVDALYVTRVQKERIETAHEGRELEEEYPVVDKRLLKQKEFKETLVMHPLPRVDELAHEVDADPRSMYFKQAARGVPIRMALISLLLGAKEVDIREERWPAFVQKRDYPVYRRDTGIVCGNENCVSRQVTETRYIKPEFQIVSNDPLTLRCVYCAHEIHPQYIASSKWHQGTVENKRYYSASSFMLKRIHPENIIIFDSEDEARAGGFLPSKKALQA